ncbi:hypothetical protein CTAYLR_008760 [Chrysophaeum taylorii]|uniref:TLC domain-containing protein n=1 Tax=Chrysophaeum taylorii TaxID=2483200 RepID=A0AAD7UCY4_9STRA|nr:hypothetical protein CTAYLR_008760 [Chrysophaeum taylorii]
MGSNGQRRRVSLVAEHYNIDTASFKMRADPMLHHDKNAARDSHDVFNLVMLVPVISLNLMNWRFEWSTPLPALWHGRYFMPFWWTTCGYFVADVAFVVLWPSCVKSPRVIVRHHVCTLAYICLPLFMPECRWLMGSCMIVEVNTWLLIARRFFNRAGDAPFCSIGVPFTKSLRIKLISVGFYLTWFVIRILFYPALFFMILTAYEERTKQLGTRLNGLAIAPLFHLVFIYLNFKWTVDLVRSKLRSSPPAKGL